MNVAERFTEVKMSKNSQDVRIALLEQSHAMIQETLLRMEKRFDFIDKKFERVDDQFNSLRAEIHSVRQEGWSQMRWILIFVIGFMGSPVITALCKFVHLS